MITTDKAYKALTRSELQNLNFKLPGDDRSELWLGVKHYYIANTVVNRMRFNGYTITNEEWYTSPDHNQLLGTVTVFPNLEKTLPYPGIEYQMAIRNSTDCRYAIRFSVGARVISRGNGLYVGDCRTKRKHTTYLMLNQTIDNAILDFESLIIKIPSFIDKLRAIPLTNEQATTIMFEAHRRTAIAFCYLRDVFEEWIQPVCPEFYDNNAWSLYNAFTHGFKQLSVMQQYEYFPRLKELFDDIIRRNGCITSPRLVPTLLQ